MSPRTITDVACTACGCVCDDLSVTVDDTSILNVKRGCPKAEAWFASQSRPVLAASIEGMTSSFDAAVDRAAEILKNARNPLILGLNRSTTASHRAALTLAEKLRATIDSGVTISTLAMRQIGQSTCTLGDLRDRADLVLFWHCNPASEYPRFFERFIDAPGRFTPNGRTNRFLVVVDQTETATATQASVFLPLDSERNWVTLTNLRLYLAGKPHTLDAAWTELAGRLKTCRNGVIVFGNCHRPRELETLFQLVAELNRFTRFSTVELKGNVSGSHETMTWQTGYPFAISFAVGAPHHDADTFTAEAMLSRSQIDAGLILGSDSLATLSGKAFDYLRTIPVIRLDAAAAVCDLHCTVTITTSTFGLHTPGHATRMDGVTIPLKVLLGSEYPDEADVIDRIHQAIVRDHAARS